MCYLLLNRVFAVWCNLYNDADNNFYYKYILVGHIMLDRAVPLLESVVRCIVELCCVYRIIIIERICIVKYYIMMK